MTLFAFRVRTSRGKPSGGDPPEASALDAATIPDSPHVLRLQNSRGGPYYLAPDSAEPLPEGMWAELDPDAVTTEANRINKRPQRERITTALPPEVRGRLSSGGPAAQRLLKQLDRHQAPFPDAPEKRPR